ncbi:MAG: immunoglobulin domain-containing protein [Verrucomicrobiales bacterium]|nr:immunoglobulin domain-containing protein [Verrucomicrobiales bacterium]
MKTPVRRVRLSRFLAGILLANSGVVQTEVLPPELRVTPEVSLPGFVWRVSQLSLEGELPNTLKRAEDQLAGRITGEDGQPLPNRADPNAVGAALGPATPADPSWAPIRFDIESVINLNESGGGWDGGFGPDNQMPGIPGNGPFRPLDNIAAEILTFIELPAGLTIMGVNSDDGFRTTAGNVADPASALVLGEFDGGRPPEDTLFKVEVVEAGVYPFRTVWEEGGGGSSIEWFTVQPDGTRVLINDLARGGLAAYRSELVDPRPRLVKQPYSRVGAPGGEVTFAVTAAGAPELHYQWLKGGVPLVGSDRIRGVLTDRLIIANLVPEDAGQYSVRVSNAEGEVTSHEATLAVDDVPSPPNDYFAEASVLSGRRLVTASWNYGASAEVGEPRHGDRAASRSVWWRWTAPYSEWVELKTDRSSLDTVLAVYTGSSLAQLHGVATNDNAGEWLNSRLVFSAEAGTTYWIAVDGRDGQQGSLWLWLNAEDVSPLVPLDHLGSWPGGNTGHPVVVWPSGDRAYVAQQEGGLAILDITDPARPVRLGGIQTADRAYDVCVVGDYAYVADANQGIQVVRVTDPTRPVRVAGYACEALRIRAAGSLLYVAAGWSGLEILDISEPENPTRVGGHPSPAWVEDLDVDAAEGLAYLAEPPTGMLIVSVADPAHPMQLGTHVSTSGWIWAVRVVGSRAYLGLGVEGIDIVSVADRENPTFLGHYSPSEALARSIDADGDYAYVADGWGGLLILGVSDPANPVRIGSLALGGFGRGVVVRDSLAFLAASKNGVEIIGVAAPSDPVLRGAWDEAEYVNSVNASGPHAFLATEAGLAVLDVSHPDAPACLARTGSPREASDVELVAGDAYVTGWWDGVVEIVEVEDPTQPNLVGRASIGGGAQDTQVRGAHAYVAGTPFVVLDVRDRTAPAPIASLELECCASAVSLSGDYAYVAGSAPGLQIVDIGTPTAPGWAGQYAPPVAASAVTSVGRLLYLAGSGGVEILDLADPVAPVRLGGLELAEATSVHVDGRYAYVAAGFEGVVVLDVRDPGAPGVVARFRTRVRVDRVQVADGRIYAADGREGLVILGNPFPVNSPPAIAGIPDQMMPVRVNPGDPSLTVSFTVQDAETMPDYLLVSVASSDLALLPASAMVLGGNGAERSLELAPAAGASGTAQVTVTISDGRLQTADTFLLTVVSGEVPPYATDFNHFATGTVHGQDGWEAMDERGSWGNVLDLGDGNKVLAIVAGRPGDVWGGEVGRLYNQPSTRRFLTVTFDYLFTIQQGFWFMDNYAPEATPESLRFSDGQWAQSNAEPATYGFWTEPQQWHRIGFEVDQTARRITQVMFDGAWLPEDDTQGLAPGAQLDRFMFRGASYDFDGAQGYPELWIDNLTITDSDTTSAEPYLRRQTPAPGATDVIPFQAIEVEIVDGPLAMVQPESILLSLDGVTVSPDIAKAGIVTVLHYQPPAPFPGDSEHAVSLRYTAGERVYVHAWDFRVLTSPVLPPEMRVAPTSQPGFLWRVTQADLAWELPNSLQRTEEQLAGLVFGENGLPPTARTNTVGCAGPAAGRSLLGSHCVRHRLGHQSGRVRRVVGRRLCPG